MSISAMKQAYQVPLVEQLESVPADALMMYEHHKFHHESIPVGRLCHEAAEALRQAIAEAEKPKMRRTTRDEKIVNPGVYEVPVHARPVVHEVRCTYPQCQATNGCVGACSKTTPVQASDMSEKHVHESDKDRHEFECPRCGHCCQQVVDDLIAKIKEKDQLIKLLKEEIGFAERGYTKMGRNDG